MEPLLRWIQSTSSPQGVIAINPVFRLWLTLSFLPLVYRLSVAWLQQGSQGVSHFWHQFAVGLASDWYLSVLFVVLFIIKPKRGSRVTQRLWSGLLLGVYGSYIVFLIANAVNVYYRRTNLAAAELSLVFDLPDLMDSIRAEFTFFRCTVLLGLMIMISLIIHAVWKIEKSAEEKDRIVATVSGSKGRHLGLRLFVLLAIGLALRSGSLASRVILHEPLETNPVTFIHWRWSVRQNFFKSLEANTLDQEAITKLLRELGRTPLSQMKDRETLGATSLAENGEVPLWRNQRSALWPELQSEPPKKKITNVVLILLESMSRSFVLDHPEVAPELQKWGSSQAIQFERHFATAYRTCGAQFSMLCSLYDPPEYYVSRDFPDSRFRCLPEILKDKGFSTYWVTGADAQFDYNGHFLNRNGIMQAITRSDISPDATGSSYGADDSYAYEKALSTLDAHPEGTFIYTMTTSNHHPYVVPQAFIEKYPQIKDWEPIRKSYFYADRQIGDFLRKAETRTWFENTVFVIAGDHAHWGFEGKGLSDVGLNYLELRRRFNTMMMIRIPGVKPRIINLWDTSHIDISPTILDVLGIDALSDGLGINMLVKNSPDRWIGSQDNSRQTLFAIHRDNAALIRDGESKKCRFLTPEGATESCSESQTKDIERFEQQYYIPIHHYLREQNR